MYYEESLYKQNYFKSEYDKNIMLYGKETIYEPLGISPEKLLEYLKEHNTIQSYQLCFGVRLGEKVNGGLVLIFERIGFTEKDTAILLHLLTQKEISIEAIFFIDCAFKTSYEIAKSKDIRTKLCFRNCNFLRSVICKGDILNDCIFNKCAFKENLSLSNITINAPLFVEDCRFETNGDLLLQKTTFNDKVVITNTLFKGNFSLKEATIKEGIHLDSVSFIRGFNFTDIKLSEKLHIHNIATAGYKVSQKDAKVLVDVLKAHGYQEHQIEAMGLDTSDNKRSPKTDYLKPKEAADFVHKSREYLQKLRSKDKKIGITNRSIPLKEDGRDILYPVDALLAFREQDWETLRNLRIQYKYNPQKN